MVAETRVYKKIVMFSLALMIVTVVSGVAGAGLLDHKITRDDNAVLGCWVYGTPEGILVWQWGPESVIYDTHTSLALTLLSNVPAMPALREDGPGTQQIDSPQGGKMPKFQDVCLQNRRQLLTRYLFLSDEADRVVLKKLWDNRKKVREYASLYFGQGDLARLKSLQEDLRARVSIPRVKTDHGQKRTPFFTTLSGYFGYCDPFFPEVPCDPLPGSLRGRGGATGISGERWADLMQNPGASALFGKAAGKVSATAAEQISLDEAVELLVKIRKDASDFAPADGRPDVSYTNCQHADYYVGIESANEDKEANEVWKAYDISKRPFSRERDTQEILCIRISSDNRIIHAEPAFVVTPENRNSSGIWECTHFANVPGYSPCNSRITKASVIRSIGKNVAAAVMSFGLGSGSWQELNSEKIKSVVEKIDVNALSGAAEASRKAQRQRLEALEE